MVDRAGNGELTDSGLYEQVQGDGRTALGVHGNDVDLEVAGSSRSTADDASAGINAQPVRKVLGSPVHSLGANSLDSEPIALTHSSVGQGLGYDGGNTVVGDIKGKPCRGSALILGSSSDVHIESPVLGGNAGNGPGVLVHLQTVGQALSGPGAGGAISGLHGGAVPDALVAVLQAGSGDVQRRTDPQGELVLSPALVVLSSHLNEVVAAGLGRALDNAGRGVNLQTLRKALGIPAESAAVGLHNHPVGLTGSRSIHRLGNESRISGVRQDRQVNDLCLAGQAVTDLEIILTAPNRCAGDDSGGRINSQPVREPAGFPHGFGTGGFHLHCVAHIHYRIRQLFGKDLAAVDRKRCCSQHGHCHHSRKGCGQYPLRETLLLCTH